MTLYAPFTMLSARALEFSSEADNVILNYNTKTPGKRLLKTPGKTALRNRTALQENAMYYAGGSMTVNSKGKYMQMHTPFHPATIRKFHCLVQHMSSKSTPDFQRQRGMLRRC